jgi:uncharacterized protein (TIGR02246 family)
VTDQDEIRRTLASYAQHNDDRNAAAWSELFAEDGRFVPGNGVFDGRAAIRGFIDAHYANTPNRQTKHLCGLPVIVVDGDSATAASDVLYYDRRDGGPWRIAGINHYADRLVRSGDRWLFQERRNISR